MCQECAAPAPCLPQRFGRARSPRLCSAALRSLGTRSRSRLDTWGNVRVQRGNSSALTGSPLFSFPQWAGGRGWTAADATSGMLRTMLGGPPSAAGCRARQGLTDNKTPLGRGANTTCRAYRPLAVYPDPRAPPAAHAGGAAAESTPTSAAPRLRRLGTRRRGGGGDTPNLLPGFAWQSLGPTRQRGAGWASLPFKCASRD